MFISSFTHRHQTTRSTGAKEARMIKPSTAPAHAATRREQSINTCAKQQCELGPRYHIDDPDKIYTEMDNF